MYVYLLSGAPEFSRVLEYIVTLCVFVQATPIRVHLKVGIEEVVTVDQQLLENIIYIFGKTI